MEKITIVIPCYNEEAALPYFLREIFVDVLQHIRDIAVNDSIRIIKKVNYQPVDRFLLVQFHVVTTLHPFYRFIILCIFSASPHTAGES